MKKYLKDVSVKSAVFLMAYYITNSVFQSFMPLYYKDLLFNDTQIGLINAMIAIFHAVLGKNGRPRKEPEPPSVFHVLIGRRHHADCENDERILAASDSDHIFRFLLYVSSADGRQHCA